MRQFPDWRLLAPEPATNHKQIILLSAVGCSRQTNEGFRAARHSMILLQALSFPRPNNEVIMAVDRPRDLLNSNLEGARAPGGEGWTQ